MVFYKKIVKHLFLSFICFVAAILWIFLLNKTRPLSTNDHMILTQMWIEKVKQNPVGYGLGVSWPSAFYTKKSQNLYEIKKYVPEILIYK